MAEQVKLPDMGEGVESATVVGILVEPGDAIEVDQGIVELETDKAVAEVPSPKAGTVKEILVEKDQEVKPGDPLLTLEAGDGGEEEGGEEGEEKPEPEKDKKKAKKKAKKKEEKEEKEEPAEKEPKAEEPEETKEQEPAEEDEEEKAPEEETAGEEEPEAEAGGPVSTAKASDIPAAPSARRLARELGVDLQSVSGSGEGGWITEQDIKAAARESAGGAGGKQAGRGERDKWGPVRREKMRQIRRSIARKMAESQEATAHVTHFADADVTDLEAFRRKHKQDFAPEGVELTMLPFVVRALVDALKSHPIVNASLDADAGEITYKDYVSIGIAVDTDRGLVVPVLRDADCLSVVDASKAIHELTDKVRGDDFEIEDLRGGTFTVSNLGSIGGKYATPIINHPESAILLTGRASDQPVVRDGQIVVRRILPLSLTYDHRIIDGAEAGRFLNDVIAYLEDPARLLIR